MFSEQLAAAEAAAPRRRLRVPAWGVCRWVGGRRAWVGRRRLRVLPWRGERGAATAEMVMMMPLLGLLLIPLVYLLALAATEMRVVDAAFEAARAAARHDSRPAVLALAHRVAPTGSHVQVTSSAGTVTATVSVTAHGPRSLFQWLPGVDLHATSVAVEERS